MLNGELFSIEVETVKFAIVDDDAAFAQVMREKIVRLCENKGVAYSIDVFNNPRDVISEEVVSRYDVITLDIEMPLMSGFEVAERFNSMKNPQNAPYIIFVSSKEHLVFDALRHFPYSFVRKSHLIELESCILRIINILAPFYTVKDGRSTAVIKLNNLIYVEKISHYVHYVTIQDVYRERTTIDALLKNFSEYGFIKVHSGAIVNMAHIKEMSAEWVRMSDDKVIPVSRTYRKSLKEKFKEWMVKL